jgi:isopentenyl diphosphate isomerase/L-lactate dehydrogenase-like FMN-dependent dehydrogenase
MDTYRAIEERARRRFPRIAFDAVAGGADDEVTLRRNRAAFDDIALIPRLLRGVEEVSTEVELFGQRARTPVLLGPAGISVVAGNRAFGEAIRGATAAGTFTALSAFLPLDAVAREGEPPQWAHLYLLRDRDETRRRIETAQRRGCSALILTAAAPVNGNRERELRNGTTFPLQLRVRDVLRRPWWLGEYLSRDLARSMGERVRREPAQGGPWDAVRKIHLSGQSWDDLRWVREMWDGPLLLKGVLAPEDGAAAVEAGCEGVIVSSHGGRQLDSAPAAIEMLPEVVAAVAGRGRVLVDSGITRGTDVVKALALGASAVLLGKAWIYAVMTGGADGITRLLTQLEYEIGNTMHLMGVGDVADLGPDSIRLRAGRAWERVAPR